LLTGLIGIEIYGAHMEQVLARYLVLIVAVTGGAAIGATVGVVSGLVLSLASIANMYQMSLLAFAGLLGGLLKEGRKIAVSIGLLISTLSISLYGESFSYLIGGLLESTIAITFFLLTPYAFIKQIAKYIPATIEQ